MFFVLFITLCTFSQVALTSELESDTAIFVVGWYDVGKVALDGQPGVIEVEKGWRMGREINTVVFDPDRTNIDALEKALKQSGTYIRTVSD